MILRTAQPEDAEAICAVWNPLIRESATTFTTEEKSPVALRKSIESGQGGFFVAKTDAQVDPLLGFATYFPFRAGPGYAHTKEHSIHLSPDARGKGIGRALMTHLERHARDADVHSLIAGISGENPDGQRFHAALGYKEIARLPQVGRKFGRWMDLVLMQKFL